MKVKYHQLFSSVRAKKPVIFHMPSRGRGKPRVGKKRAGEKLRPLLLQQNNANHPSTSTGGFTSNKFVQLNPDEDLSDDDASIYSALSHPNKRQKQNTTKIHTNTIKPPPVNIVGLDIKNVKHILGSIKTFENDFTTQLSPQGIKVFPSSIDAFRALKFHLQTSKIKFFTHDLREDQTTKFVLHGMYSMPEDELTNHLKAMEISPIKIKRMIVKNSKYSDHCVYLIYFKKTDKVKISQLRENNVINYVKVRWDYYSNRRKGPIQCSKCMQYGHGGNNCFLEPKCIRCSQQHVSSECTLLNDIVTGTRLTRIPDVLLKCALCGQNHAANFSKCEKRIEFIQRQQLYQNRTQRRPVQRQSQFQVARQLTDFNFPPINSNVNGPAWKSPPLQNTNPNRMTNSSNDLFSTDELMQIFQELMSAINQATTKVEQITALGKIVIKYSN